MLNSFEFGFTKKLFLTETKIKEKKLSVSDFKGAPNKTLAMRIERKIKGRKDQQNRKRFKPEPTHLI